MEMVGGEVVDFGWFCGLHLPVRSWRSPGCG